MAANQKRTFLIAIKATGDKALKQAVQSLKKVERTTKSISNSMKGLRNIFLATFAGIGISRIADAADSIQLLSDRINIFTGDTVEGARALDLLFDAANLTNTSVDSLATTFNRVALATQELGINTNELIGFTATLQNTFRLSGATIAESGAAAIQLSQGLASGQLRGQELRSVLEQNAVIGGILAETLGTTRGQLIKFAESGKITSEVVLTALSKNALELNSQAAKLGQTFGQTLTKALNRVKKTINELNRDFKINEKFADSVDVVVNNLDKVARGIAVLGAGVLIANIGKLSSALFALASPLTAIVGGATLIAVFFEEIPVFLDLATQYVDKFFLSIFKNINKLVLTAGDSDNFLIKKIFGSEAVQKKARDRLESNNKELENTNSIIDKLQSKLTKNSIAPSSDSITDFSKLIVRSSGPALDTLEKINTAFRSGRIDLREYNTALNVLEKNNLKKRFDEGRISLDEYRSSLIQLGDEADTTFGKLVEGVELGSRSYLKSAGSLTIQFGNLVDNTFKGLEDSIFDFTKGASDAFAKLTQQILDDLLRIAIRSQIVAPLSGSLQGLFSGSFTSNEAAFQSSRTTGFQDLGSGGLASRKGNVLPFAQGGIVTRPTSFPLSTGTGLMAEAGAPEAVVPLTRTSNGDLGVQAVPSNVTVNVNNQAGVDVDVQSQQNGNNQILDITITKAVNNAINTGRLDKSLSANYGLSRKGSR